MTAAGLLDSNVVIALVADRHERHEASYALFAADRVGRLAVAAHSFAEAYNTLTRRGERAPFRFEPDEAWSALESVRAATTLVGLTPAQTFDVLRRYAHQGGIGARLYDMLIGEAAVVHAIPAIITWNGVHMSGLFPALSVLTPTQFIAG